MEPGSPCCPSTGEMWDQPPSQPAPARERTDAGLLKARGVGMQDWGISALQAASLLVQMNVHALNPVAEHHRTPHLMLLSPLLPRRAQLLLTLCSSFPFGCVFHAVGASSSAEGGAYFINSATFFPAN